MAKEETKPQHVVYGSAGMAASGLMPGAKKKGKTAEKAEAKEVLPEASAGEAPSPSLTQPSNLEAPPETSSVTPETPETPETPDPFEGENTLGAAILLETSSGASTNSIEMLFQQLDGVRLIAVSEEAESAHEDVSMRFGVEQAFPNHRLMLEEINPAIVAIPSLSSGRHHELATLALESGAHVLLESPVTQTLKEADELLSLASAQERSVAVFLRQRHEPAIQQFHRERETLIGDLLEIQIFGESHEIAGGEDLLRNGLPLLDLALWFAGPPSYCTADITTSGIPAIDEDAHESKEGDFGPLLGDEISAEFTMESGIRVRFLSNRAHRSVVGPAGMLFVGSKGSMRLFAGPPCHLSLGIAEDPSAADRTVQWNQWPSPEATGYVPQDEATVQNRAVVEDWLSTIRGETDGVSTLEAASSALEMVHGIWQAGVTKKRAYFPLANRLHPLAEPS
ncbi:MAG: Gfo/Idh/MocA family oxidoreductase [Verrucomicrobiota bacterium]